MTSYLRTVGVLRPATFPASEVSLVAFKDVRVSTARNYLVKGLIPRSGLVVIYGAPKSGNRSSPPTLSPISHSVGSIVVAVSSRPVRLCCLRRPCRFPAGLTPSASVSSGRGQVDSVPFYYVAANLDLDRRSRSADPVYSFELGSVDPVAVVIDTLNRSLNGSESQDEDMGRYLRAANGIIEAFGCAVVVVHHSGIDASRPRGHTSLTAAADVRSGWTATEPTTSLPQWSG